MRFWLAAAAALAIAGCGKEAPNKVNIDLNDSSGSSTPVIKSDPTGKYKCLACNGLKTNDTKCPKCGAVLKAEEKPASTPKGPKSGETVGKSTTSAVYACPNCTFTDPRGKGKTCIKHTDTKMKLQQFVCAKCSVKESVAGKCSKCGAELKRTLE